MAKREFLQLAHNYDSKKHSIGGWFLSEKLDGVRCFWDGGISTGIPANEVPYANVAKDHRLKEIRLATGLWSRYGHPIHAPDWFLEYFPPFPLDGELYLGRGQFQQLSSIVKRLEPGPEWSSVKFVIFDSPTYEAVFADGKINNTNFKKNFSGCLEWALRNIKTLRQGPKGSSFESVYRSLCKIIRYDGGDPISVHMQVQLPFYTKEAEQIVTKELERVENLGGEGLMLRHPVHLWKPERVHHILKMKSKQDDEGTVVGYTWGRETDLGSKLLGLMGALVLDYKGRRFELSGFTDLEREMVHGNPPISAREIGIQHPGECVDEGIWNPMFPLGSKVTFTYRELTVDGIPKEARYKRVSENL